MFPLAPTLIALASLTSHLASAAAVNLTDPCGPEIPVPGVGNTCTEPLIQTGTSIYGVQCFGRVAPSLPPSGTDCNDLIPQICSTMTSPSLIREVWHWLSNPADTCTVGFYMPGSKVYGNSTAFSAAVPSDDRCQATIFDGMLDACTKPEGQIWQTAAVNLAVYPGKGVNGEPAKGGEQYPSYFIAAQQPETPVNPQ